MSIMELGALGEFVGAIAVVISLIFVGLQVRQNTKMVRAQTATVDRQVSNEFADMATAEVFRSPHLPSIMAKIHAVDGVPELVTAFVDRYGLTEEEALRWTRWEMRIWLNIQNDYRRYGAYQERTKR